MLWLIAMVKGVSLRRCAQRKVDALFCGLILLGGCGSAYGDWSMRPFGGIGGDDFEIYPDRGAPEIISISRSAYPGAVFGIYYESGSWKNEQIGTLPDRAHAIALGESCVGAPSIYVGSDDYRISEFRFSLSKGWQSRLVGRDRVSYDNSPLLNNRGLVTYRAADRGFLFSSNRDEIHIYQCKGNAWSNAGAILAFGEYPRIISSGDGRGDGIERVYGSNKKRGLFEAEFNASGEWRVVPIGVKGVQSLAFGDARNDGKRKLYVSAGGQVEELIFHNGGWISTRVGESCGIINHKMLIGSFRPDRMNRLYMGCDSKLREFSFINDSWEIEDYSVSGIHSIGAGPPGSSDFARIVTADAGGFEFLDWKSGIELVVADFQGKDVDSDVATAFSDLLRTDFADMGGCSTLERKEMDSLIGERRLHEADAKGKAIELGRLLFAKRVVTGSLDKFMKDYWAHGYSLSIETGGVLRTASAHWNSLPGMQEAARSIASDLCPQ